MILQMIWSLILDHYIKIDLLKVKIKINKKILIFDLNLIKSDLLQVCKCRLAQARLHYITLLAQNMVWPFVWWYGLELWIQKYGLRWWMQIIMTVVNPACV